MSARLQRVVLSFERDAVTVRALYRTKDGPNPGAKARAREATELARSGLREALAALEGHVDIVGESGFETREDVVVVERRAAV